MLERIYNISLSNIVEELNCDYDNYEDDVIVYSNNNGLYSTDRRGNLIFNSYEEEEKKYVSGYHKPIRYNRNKKYNRYEK